MRTHHRLLATGVALAALAAGCTNENAAGPLPTATLDRGVDAGPFTATPAEESAPPATATESAPNTPVPTPTDVPSDVPASPAATPAPGGTASPSPEPDGPPLPPAVDMEIELSYAISQKLRRAVLVACPDDLDAAGPFQCSLTGPNIGTRPIFVEPDPEGGHNYRIGLDVPKLTNELLGVVTEQVGQPITIACPPDIRADVGTRFFCTITVQDGRVRTISGTVADGVGNVSFTIENPDAG